MSTGIVEAGIDSTLTLYQRSQVTGGLEGLLQAGLGMIIQDADVVVFEVFTPRPSARSPRRHDLEPLVVEGAVRAICEAEMTTFVPQRPEKRRLTSGTLQDSEALLHAMGLWTTKHQVGRKDADDVNAAMMHLLAWGREQKLVPVLYGIMQGIAKMAITTNQGGNL